MIAARPLVHELVRLAQPKGDRLGRARLDVNERIVGFPDEVITDVLASLPSDFLTAYPETRPFYSRLARHHGLRSEQVLVAAGSEAAIRYVFEAFLDRNDRVVLLDPSFAMFDVYARLCGADVVAVPFDRSFNIRIDDVVDAIDRRTRVVAIANPNNPTGTVLAQDALLRVIEKAGSAGAVCLIDEAYYYFHQETMAPFLSQYEHLVVTRTFSKACGLASVRLGYALGSPSVIAEAQKLQPIDHANGFAVAFGTYMLDHEEIVWKYATDVREGRAWVARELTELGLTVIETAANFVLVDAGAHQEALVQWLRDSNILVGSGLRFPFQNEYFRITVGPVDAMRPFVEAVSRFVRRPASVVSS